MTVDLPTNSQGYVAVVTYNTYQGTNSFAPPSGWTEVAGDTYAGCSPTANCKTVIYVANTTTPGTSWGWTGDALIGIGIIGYTMPVEVHASGGALYTSTAPSVNVAQPSLVLRVAGDLNDSSSSITYPSGATIGRHQSIGWNSGMGFRPA